ncbi:MAG: hypothetical protein M3478_04620 [Planctomycetota bacterium]|nr:hypothetical protein [Planctomycetota bacterium]
MSTAPDPLRDGIREILLKDWDPSNAARFDAARGEYDSFIDPIAALLDEGGDEDALVAYLHDVEQHVMCFPSLDTRRLRPVARRLLRLRASLA